METYESLLAAITPTTGETREVIDPATGEKIGTAPEQGLTALPAAIDRAVAFDCAIFPRRWQSTL
mgnify:CR=1 FL=1